MKCPKCGYLGFDDAERCRNCGYDFSLVRDPEVPELPIRSRHPTEAFPDLALSMPSADGSSLADLDVEVDRGPANAPAPLMSAASGGDSPLRSFVAEGAPTPVPTPAAPAASGAARPLSSAAASPAASAAPPSGDLPLFGGPITDDVPLITRPSPPRPPLAVRRATPEVPRVRSEPPRTAPVDLPLDLGESDLAVSPVGPAARAHALAWPAPRPEPAEDASLGARFAAMAIDLVVLGAIDAIIVYFTLQICGLTAADLGMIPKLPLLSFFALQNGGYLVAFTAGGQTLGKMATGIRVVTAGSDSSLDVGRATMRALLWVVLAVPAGLGFLSAVFSADHRGLHDRFAGTRVVRASA